MKSEIFSSKSLLVLGGLTVSLLLPFVNKAFHIDDTLFLWCAEQIRAHPFDFYGFMANWNGVERPMYEINQNPPLVSYYIAFVTSLFGWSEIVLHIAFLVPAVFLSIGIYLLALLFCPMSLFAAMLAVTTPVFVVSATNIMCDILMVAFYVWAAVFWLYGIEKDKTLYFFIASILISLSALTKYFGISMVPLLMVYTVIKNRKFDTRFFYLIIPIAVMLAYQWLTLTLYDTSLLSNAAAYALNRGVADSPDKLITKTMIGLSFCGGCMVSIFFYAHMLWSRLFLLAGALLTISLTVVFLMVNSFSAIPLINFSVDPTFVIVQFVLFILIGTQIVYLAISDLFKNKDAKSLLLFLWVLGTFLFSSHVNWTINARTMLPMIPAVSILIARRLSDRHEFSVNGNARRAFWPLVPGTVIALMISWGDATFANCQRSIAQDIASDLNNYQYEVWFQGHWGFQYYMQRYNAKALDYKNSLIGTGDIIIIPKTNTGQLQLPLDKFTFVKQLECDPLKWAGTMSRRNSAGFYSDTKGKLILPYVFGDIEPEKYYVFLVGRFNKPDEYIRKLKGHI